MNFPGVLGSIKQILLFEFYVEGTAITCRKVPGRIGRTLLVLKHGKRLDLVRGTGDQVLHDV